ncbi:RelA/SpoT domain-containing protein [Streptomyces sp. NPDC046979]|uniref:GTP pyrophosphokinase n=1 Tax=Streptomyces sp. NPDC046979 TaxID=3154604 RepID=UPI0033EF924A
MESKSQEYWTDSYGRMHHNYVAYCKKLQELIGEVIQSAGIDIVQIDGRAKDVASFSEKMNRKKGKYEDPLAEITDLVGLRVITYYIEDVDEVAELIYREFKVLEEHSGDKASELADDQFGYTSFHLIFELADSRKPLPEWRAFADFRAEIQIRTALQHAWAAVNHKIDYKKSHEVPRQLRRRLFRLSALFELADEEFSHIKEESRKISEDYARIVVSGDYDIDVNANSLSAWISVDPLIQDLLGKAQAVGYPLMGKSDQTEFDRTRLASTLDSYSINKLSALVEVLQESIEHVPEILAALNDEQSEDNGFTTPEDLVLQLFLVLNKAESGEWSDFYTSHGENFEQAKNLVP